MKLKEVVLDFTKYHSEIDFLVVRENGYGCYVYITKNSWVYNHGDDMDLFLESIPDEEYECDEIITPKFVFYCKYKNGSYEIFSKRAEYNLTISHYVENQPTIDDFLKENIE